MFDCTCNTQNSLLLNQHNGDDAPHDYLVSGRTNVSSGMFIKQAVRCGSPSLLVGGVDNFTSQRNIYSQNIVVFDCTCNTQNSLLLNQHNGDDAPHDCWFEPRCPAVRSSASR